MKLKDRKLNTNPTNKIVVSLQLILMILTQKNVLGLATIKQSTAK